MPEPILDGLSWQNWKQSQREKNSFQASTTKYQCQVLNEELYGTTLEKKILNTLKKDNQKEKKPDVTVKKEFGQVKYLRNLLVL